MLTLQEQFQSHIPVMLSEVLNYLNLQPNGIYMDGTVGAGGHSSQILKNLSSNGRLIGLDQDADALDISINRFSASTPLFSTHKSSYPKLFRHWVWTN